MCWKPGLGLLLVAAYFFPCLLVGCSREKEERNDALEAAKLLFESTLPAYIDVSKFEGTYTHRSAGSSDGIVRLKAQIEATEDLYEPREPRLSSSIETRRLLADVEAEDRRVAALVGGSPEVRARLDAELNKLRNDVQNLTAVEIITKKGGTQEIFGKATVLNNPRMRADNLELDMKVDLGKPLADFKRPVLVGSKEDAEKREEVANQLASVKDAFATAQTEIAQAKKDQGARQQASGPNNQ